MIPCGIYVSCHSSEAVSLTATCYNVIAADMPDLLYNLFFGANKQCKSSLNDLNLLDKMFLRVIVYQVYLNTFLSVNSDKHSQLKQCHAIKIHIKAMYLLKTRICRTQYITTDVK